MKNDISHDGHRQRLKNRFLSDGFDSFEPHNILELLLFYSVPRKDTNETAHRLLNEFGNIKNVFDADFNDLVKVNGISENSATLIKMIPQLCKAYMTDIGNKEIFDTSEKLGNFFVNQYIGVTNEVVYAALLNNRFEIINLVKVHEGSVNSSMVSPRKIIDKVIRYNASMIVLAHNHPNGVAVPSVEDIDTTADMMRLFDTFDIKLIEHFVIAGNSYVPIVHNTPSLSELQ